MRGSDREEIWIVAVNGIAIPAAITASAVDYDGTERTVDVL
jgi:hypothetical protein